MAIEFARRAERFLAVEVRLGGKAYLRANSLSALGLARYLATTLRRNWAKLPMPRLVPQRMSCPGELG